MDHTRFYYYVMAGAQLLADQRAHVVQHHRLDGTKTLAHDLLNQFEAIQDAVWCAYEQIVEAEQLINRSPQPSLTLNPIPAEAVYLGSINEATFYAYSHAIWKRAYGHWFIICAHDAWSNHPEAQYLALTTTHSRTSTSDTAQDNGWT